jgi:hypothetical protein
VDRNNEVTSASSASAPSKTLSRLRFRVGRTLDLLLGPGAGRGSRAIAPAPFYPLARERYVNFDCQALPAPVVNHGERAVSSAAPQTVMDEVHGPDLIGGGRQYPHHTQMAQSFALLAPAQRQTFLPIDGVAAASVVGSPQGITPPTLPRIRTSGTTASGSSVHGFTT